jgi:filamentous hemagglutinin family protein
MTSALAPLTLAPAMAGPNGATVVGGSATVQGQGTSNVTVNQTSQSAIINWNTFNIGAGQTTRINMPSASSVELDRVTGGLGPSQIFGLLYSNGRVFLVNPDGILFGAGSRINVGGLLATTNDISNANFMAGRYRFTIPGNPSASIVNQGSITAQTGGFAALVAPGVRNTGTITAKLGTISLASGNAFTLDLYGDNLITLGLKDSIASQVIDVSTGKPLSSLVSNAGTLKANGGKVELTAVAARKVVDSVINNTGNIEANTIGTHNGMIVLGAATSARKPAGTPTQTVKVSGTLSAAGKQNGTTGGTIEVTGENVQLSGATINAAGQAGGGAVLVGGDWGGGHPNTGLVSNPSAYLQPYVVPTANSVSIDAATTINASATNTGNGGKVIVWSNDATTFYGTILAKGGPQSGQGGFVETSGHQLTFNGMVNTGAPNGPSGTLLLDPLNATIAATAGSEVITTSSIENALVTGDVIVTTVGTTGSEAGDIIVASNLSWANASTLTLSAYRDIDINSGVTISNTGAGNLVLRADATGTGTGVVTFVATGQVDFSESTGTVSIFYNPVWFSVPVFCEAPCSGTPAPVVVPIAKDYGSSVLANSSVTDQLTAYMLVNTVDHLQDIQNNLSGNYALSKDIDASVTASWNGGTGFVPIGQTNAELGPNGNYLGSFTGIFDGLGHTVSNLTINATVPFSSDDAAHLIALFGGIGIGGIVENVGLTGVSISATSGCGGFNACISLRVAGIAAENWGTITDAYVTGTIMGTFSPPAGQGVWAGGLVALNYGTISQSYSTAAVSAIDDINGVYAGFIGGLVTESVSVQGFATHTTVTQSYWDTQTSGQATSNGGGIGLTTSVFTSGLPSGFNPSVWGSNSSINTGYPYFLAPSAPTVFVPTVGSGPTPTATPTSSTAQAACVACAIGSIDTSLLNQAANFGKSILATTETNLQKDEQLIGSLLSDTTNFMTTGQTTTPTQATSSGASQLSVSTAANSAPTPLATILTTATTSFTFTAITQLNTSSSVYGPLVATADDPTITNRQVPIENETCLAVVLTMIARAAGDATATVNDFWNNETGASSAALKNIAGHSVTFTNYSGSFENKTFTQVNQNVPAFDTSVFNALKSGPIIIGGSISYSGGGTEAHWMLGVGVGTDTNGKQAVIANDPWTGTKVMIEPATGTVVDIMDPVTGKFYALNDVIAGTDKADFATLPVTTKGIPSYEALKTFNASGTNGGYVAVSIN